MAEMGKRRLGSSELMVSPIGLGCWQFSGSMMSSYWNAPRQKGIDAIVKTSLDGGINWFDTAEIYGFGRSEHALSLALRAAGKKDGDVIIANKWNPILRRASTIGSTFPTREKHLAPFGIDLFQVHLPYSVSSVQAQMNAMADLMNAGKIKTVGVSNFSEKKMRAAHKALKARGYTLASNQMRYSLLDRSIQKNGVLDAAKELNISIIAYSPLAQGLLGGRYHSDPDALKKVPVVRRRHFKGIIETSRPLVEALMEIGKTHNASAAEVALNWLVSYHGETVLAIPGATKLEQAQQNCRSMGFVLTRGEKDRINELSARLI
jgi:aryl-alcohol dehydrogenase-like predicted oxidoreductase